MRAYVREGPGWDLIKDDEAVAVAIYVARCNRRPSSLLAEEIASDVGDGDEALRTWAVVCETWAATNEPGSSKKAYNLGNVRKMLRAFHEEVQAENERRAANTENSPRRYAVQDRQTSFRKRRSRRSGSVRPNSTR